MKKLAYIIIFTFVLVGCNAPSVQTVEEKEMNYFLTNYEVTEYHPFTQIDVYKTIELLEKGTGIIVFGFPECPWCQVVLPVLEEAAILTETKNIYYFNPRDIRDQNTTEYKLLIALLEDYLETDDNGDLRLFVPDVYVISEGAVLYHHLGSIENQDDPNIPLTADQIDELRNIYIRMLRLI